MVSVNPLSTRTRTVAGIEVEMALAPVRRLSDGGLAAVELQVRGTEGSAVASPGELRRAARLLEQHDELDRVKASIAHDDAVRAIAAAVPVLVSLDATAVTDALRADQMGDGQRVAVTVSSRMFFAAPHEAMAAVSAARAKGFTICLEVGHNDSHSLAFLSLIEPDVIIASRDLLTALPDAEGAQIAHALAAHVERSHAIIVAEGVDDDSARAVAETFGATYGIGDLYPPQDITELAQAEIVAMPPHPVWVSPDATATTPYALATRDAPPRRGTKRLLVEMSKALESQAAAIGGSTIAVGTFQHERHFSELTAQRWRSLSEVAGFAGVYGVGLQAVRDGNYHHAPLDPDDPLVDEWTVAILGPHFSALIAAKDLHDNGPDMERTFDFVQSFDRLTVVQAVRSILHRF